MRHASRITHRQNAHWPAIRWPLIVAGSGVLFLVVGVSTVREGYREWKVDQEIREMQSEVERLEGRKLSLSELISRLGSSDAVDKEARTRLGLRKEGERVIILRGADGPSDWKGDLGQEVSATVQTDATESKTNPQRWFDYFFPKPANL